MQIQWAQDYGARSLVSSEVRSCSAPPHSEADPGIGFDVAVQDLYNILPSRMFPRSEQMLCWSFDKIQARCVPIVLDFGLAALADLWEAQSVHSPVLPPNILPLRVMVATQLVLLGP